MRGDAGGVVFEEIALEEMGGRGVRGFLLNSFAELGSSRHGKTIYLYL